MSGYYPAPAPASDNHHRQCKIETLLCASPTHPVWHVPFAVINDSLGPARIVLPGPLGSGPAVKFGRSDFPASTQRVLGCRSCYRTNICNVGKIPFVRRRTMALYVMPFKVLLCDIPTYKNLIGPGCCCVIIFPDSMQIVQVIQSSRPQPSTLIPSCPSA